MMQPLESVREALKDLEDKHMNCLLDRVAAKDDIGEQDRQIGLAKGLDLGLAALKRIECAIELSEEQQ